MNEDDLKLLSSDDLGKLEETVKRIKTELLGMAAATKSVADGTKDLNDIIKKLEPPAKSDLEKSLEEFEVFQQKRAKKAEEYNKKIAALQAASKPGEEGKDYSAQIAQAEKQRDTALAALDNAEKGKNDILYKAYQDTSKMSILGMRELTSEAETALATLQGGTYDEKNLFGMSEAQFNNIRNNVKEFDDFKKKVTDLRTATDKAETGFNKMGVGIKKVFSAGSDTKQLTEGLGEITTGLTSATEMGKLFGNSLTSLGGLSGSKELKKAGEAINSVMEVASSTMKGATTGAAFGPAGAIVGAGVGMLTSVTKIFGENKKQRELLKKQLKENKEKELFAELDINRLYRERYEWSKKIGESTLTNIARQGQELKRQSAANQQEQDELWAKLSGTKYNANEYFKKTGLFGWGKGKIVVDWELLGDKSWEEIEHLAAAGKLSEEGQKYYEALKKAREEGKALADREVQYLENVRQELTGTTYDSLVSSIVDGFKAGKQSAADFADTFEKLMKTAVAASLQRFVDDSMRGWYEEWSALSENGLTEDEIAYLQRKYNDIIDSTARKKEELEEITGVGVSDSGGNSPRSSSGGFGSMSQDTADELNGRFSALQMSAINLEQSSLVRNEQLSAIGLDTSLMRTNLSLLTFSIDEIKEINRVSMNHLYKIEKNTALLRETNSLLTKVATHTARL